MASRKIEFKAPKRPVSRVFIHCSASDNPAHDSIGVIRDWHLKRGFAMVGYHYFIKKDGSLQEGRPLEIAPAAQAGNNRGTIAICLHGLSKNGFTEEQFSTLRELCHRIHEQLPLVTFHGHKEVAAKECPVFDYQHVLGLDAKGRLT